MSRHIWQFMATMASGLSLLSPASAQIVVDPGGNGHYTDLQQALDAATAGSVIRVVGGQYGPLIVRQSVTIVGDPAPLIASPPQGYGSQPPGITLRGDGDNTFVLDNVVLSGTALFPYNAPGPGITSSGFAAISVYHSRVHGHQYGGTLTGLARGHSAICVDPGDRCAITVVDSHLEASDAHSDGSWTWGDQGAASIDAPAATVIALDSTLIGGDGSTSFLPFPPSPTPCPCPTVAGQGGDGVIAEAFYYSNTNAIPGTGAAVYLIGPGTIVPWGQQAPGVPVTAGTTVRAGFDVVTPAAMRLGKPWSLYYTLPSGSAAVLFIGTLASPQPLASQWFFLDPASLLAAAALPLNGSSATLPIPNMPALAGAEVGLQIGAWVYGAIALSRPVADIVGY